jgi:hypothetical protein
MLNSRLTRVLAAAVLVAGCANGASSTVTHKLSLSKRVPPYQVHLLEGGTEMELAGGMPLGTSGAVSKMLNETPGIKVIHLNSVGGQIQEGAHLAKMIKDRHLTTYTSAGCASACTLAFIAGAHRYIAPDAVLGFHGVSRTMGRQASLQGNQEMRDLYLDAGLPVDFVDKALATPPSDIWYPTHDELLAAHVIDGEAPATQFAKSGLAYWETYTDIDETVLGNELYATIADNDADTYDRIRKLYLDGAKSGRTVADIEAEASHFVMKEVFPGYADRSEDEPLLNFERVVEEQLQYLSENNAAACAATAFPKLELSGPDAEHVLPQSILSKEDRALAAVAESALKHPQTGPAKKASQDALMDFYTQLLVKSPETVQVMLHPEKFRDQPVKLCDAITYLIQSMTQLPPDQAASMVRAFWGSKT